VKLDWADPEDWNPLPLEEKIALVKSAVTMVDLVELCGRDVTHVITIGDVAPALLAKLPLRAARPSCTAASYSFSAASSVAQ
jgi:hypothetical protein